MTAELSTPCDYTNKSHPLSTRPPFHQMICAAPKPQPTVTLHTKALAVLKKTPAQRYMEQAEEHKQQLANVHFFHSVALHQLKQEHEKEILQLKQRMAFQEEEAAEILHQERAMANQRVIELKNAFQQEFNKISQKIVTTEALVQKLKKDLPK